MRRSIAAVLVVALVFPQLASAQTLAPGSRVRFSHQGEATRTGTVIAITPDTLEVRLEHQAAPARLPIDQVTRLDVSRGMQRQLLRRAGIGFVVGAGLGAIAGVADESGCHRGSELCFGAGGGALIGGIFFGAVGGVLGLAAGVIPSERWEPVGLEPRRVSFVAPSGSGGQGVGVRISF